MPVTKSAIKAMKQSRKANARNKAVKVEFKAKVKVVKKGIADGVKDLGKATSEAIQAIDKAAKNGVIHKNTAARRKSRLMKSVNKETGKVVEPKSIKVKTEKPARTNTTSRPGKATPKPKAKTPVKKSTKKEAK